METYQLFGLFPSIIQTYMQTILWSSQ